MRRRGAIAWRWLEAHPKHALGVMLLFVVALRIPFLSMPFESDEGGFLMVAKQWHGHGDALYTDQWVDRPPFLLLVFKLAGWLGGSPVALRFVGIGFAFITVAAAWWAGRLINGRRGALAASLIAASVGSMFAIDGYSLTGECIAGALVMVSCALILEAKYGKISPQGGIVFALVAGIVASLAFLTKQNFIDGGIFAAALLLSKPHKTWRLMLSYVIGVGIPLLATVAWAVNDQGPGITRVWVALFRFRQRSLNVIEDATLNAPLERLKWLAVLFVFTGLVLLVAQLVAAVRKAPGTRSLRVALAVMVGYDFVSILIGASWWTHYLLQFTAVLSMSAALATRKRTWRLLVRVPIGYVAVAAVVSTLVGIHLAVTGHAKGARDEIVGEWLRDAAKPGDSVVLAYGAPSIIETAGMTTPYRYSWSLPIRTRDPRLKDLVSVLAGPDAPDWLVEIGDFDWWGIDTPEFADIRAGDYRVVATVCGHDVYLRNGDQRELPAAPDC